MSQRNSNENQSSDDVGYRFSDFEIRPRERLLKQAGEPILLAPKAFDALLCLVSKAGHLVTKKELTGLLWPSTYVSEANLTNLVVSLRKAVGRDAILTVSKHGYRFVLPVEGEPGIAQATYERFVRAKDLTVQRSLQSMTQARELYWICLADNPGFAPAWAWLGRCCWFLGKFGSAASTNFDLAIAAFRRAFALNPDLACAHQFYTPVEADSGEARSAMVRLLHRLTRHPGEPETFTGLVQVLRFCGLLQESIEANSRAMDLDPAVVTSVPHTLFLMGDYAATIETYSGRAGYYLDTAAWAALGDEARANVLLRERLQRMSLSQLMTGLMGSLLDLLEGRIDEAVSRMEGTDTAREPEVLVYFARHCSRMGLGDLAVQALNRAAQSGFVCAPRTLTADPWLEAVRQHPEFAAVLATSESLIEQARAAWEIYAPAPTASKLTANS